MADPELAAVVARLYAAVDDLAARVAQLELVVYGVGDDWGDPIVTVRVSDAYL